MYHDVVLWMLKREMLVTLHLRIRIVATRDLKHRVKTERSLKMLYANARRPRHHRKHTKSKWDREENGSTKNTSFFLSPRSAHKFAKRFASAESGKSEISELNFDTDETMFKVEEEEEEEEEGDDDDEGDEDDNESNSDNTEEDEEDSGWDSTEDHMWPTIIDDPGKATPMQRRWLAAMSDGKEPTITRRFEL